MMYSRTFTERELPVGAADQQVIPEFSTCVMDMMLRFITVASS